MRILNITYDVWKQVRDDAANAVWPTFHKTIGKGKRAYTGHKDLIFVADAVGTDLTHFDANYDGASTVVEYEDDAIASIVGLTTVENRRAFDGSQVVAAQSLTLGQDRFLRVDNGSAQMNVNGAATGAVTVLWNGTEVPPGASVGSGALQFADGSQCTIPAGMAVQLIHSFRLHDGRLYSLIGLDVNETGRLYVEVTPGSRFEVVTPAAIAGVQGTRFQVIATVEGHLYCVKVVVAEGSVVVKNRWQPDAGEALEAGEAKDVKLHRRKIWERLRKRWLKRRKRFLDDYLYEVIHIDTSIDYERSDTVTDYGD